MLKDFNFETLISNIPSQHIPPSLNLILEGGCMNGAYEIGGLLLIKMLEKQKKTKIKKISGASVGAYAGFLYLTNNLEQYIDDYEGMKLNFKKTLTLSTLKEQLTILVNNLTIKQFSSLQKNKLFITFYNIQTQQQEIISSYPSRKDLITSILKSCHMPFLINGDCFYTEGNNKYIDGGIPYIFKTKTKTKTKTKNLYMYLTQINKLKTILNVSYEKTIHGRILEGLLDTYNFFLKNKQSKMCSYVDDWSLINRLYYKVIQNAYHILIYLIYLINTTFIFTKPLLVKFKKTHLFKHFSPIVKKIYEKIIIYLVFM